MSLRLKLIIIFLAIALIPLLFISTLNFHHYRKSLETTCLLNLQDIAAFKADKIETYFDGLKSNIEIAQGFYNIKKNLPVLTRLASDPDHPEFIAAQNMLHEQLRHMQSVLQLIDIMLVNPEGKVVYTSNPQHFPDNFLKPLADPEQKAFKEGKDAIYLSDIFPNKDDHDRPTLLITAGAVDFDGVFIGVIVFEVDTTLVYKVILDATGLGKTGEVLVGKKIGNQVIFLSPLKFDPKAALARKIDIGQMIGSPVQNAAQGKTGAGLSIDYRGEEVIAAWRYISSLNWGIVAKIDIQEAFAEVTKLRNLSIIILAIVIILSSITAFSIAQSISKPLKKLTEGAAIIGKGNLDYKIGTHQNDEIGQLSRSFDKMTLDLKQTTASRDELNREVSERKQAEEVIRKERNFSSAVLDTAGALVVVLDKEGHITRFNRECEEVTGYTSSEVLGHTLWEFLIPKEDLEGVRQTWEALKAGDFPLRHENRWVAKKGSQRFIAWSNTAIILPDGQIEYIIATGVDITEQKKTEEAVLISEVRYRRLFEAACDGILILNADSGQIVDVNPFIEEMLGYSHKEFLNKKLWEIGLFKNIATSKEAFLELQNKGYIRYENMPLETQDGRHIAVEFVSNVYQVDHQKVIQCNIRDITKRIQAEEALRKSRDELEIRVKERTKELAQTVDTLQTEIANRIGAENKILVYQKRLRSLATEIVLIEEKERRAIAAALHDSLGPLLAFSKRELGILRKSAPGELAEPLAYVHEKIKQAVDQTRNLTFDLSPTTLYTLGLEHALEELVEHFAQEGRFHGVCHIGEQIRPLAEDIKILLYRSVRELMVNIVKHAQAKNVHVTLTMTPDDIQVMVQDDGVGFDVSAVDLKTGKSKGFGLFNIYEHLIQAGGRIDIQVPESGGINVVLQLPLTNKKD